MEAKDLMIGDRVTHFYDGRNCVVTELREHKIAVSFVDADYKKKYSELLPEMAFEPIPLTAEILEKNGFRRECGATSPTNHYDYYALNDDYYDVHIWEFSDGLWNMVFADCEFSGLPNTQMLFSHVHELQHALRLCGIEKEILL